MNPAAIQQHPRRLLAAGLAVSPIGIGCWAIGGPDHNLGLPMGWSTAGDTASLRGLETAYQLGANLFDTADVYGHGRSERLLGHLVRQVDRDSLVLSSKVGYFAGTAAHPYLPSAMRHQLETTLENLQTDHLDIYFLHNSAFGADDQYLDGAIGQMRAFQDQGMIKTVGMRGPHRFATDRLTVPRQQREDKYARFRSLFRVVRPDYLAARFNALTPVPPPGAEDIFTFAAAHGASVLINKPLAQGLLTGKYDPSRPPRFEPGDHRLRKAWFAPQSLRIIHDGLQPLRDRFGPGTAQLAPVMLGYCLQHASNAAVLAGFTTPGQVTQNLTAPARLTDNDVAFIRSTVARIQQQLDAAGEVFTDEVPAAQAMTTSRQPPLITTPGHRNRAADGIIRLLAFNAQHASPRRARLQGAWIAGQETADLVVLTEVGPGPGGHALIDALTAHGYTSVLAPEPAVPDYRTILAARSAELIAVPSGIDVLPHRGPAATVTVAGQAIGLLGLYVPSRGPAERRNQNKRAFQQAVTNALPHFLARFTGPVIIAGDLNIVEPGHIPHHPVFGPWEYDFYRSFSRAGLVDAYRTVHPHATEHSWLGRSGQGYRFDHAFLTTRHQAQICSCSYLHAPRHQGLTDHAALTLTLSTQNT